jgi:hypothetical protein
LNLVNGPLTFLGAVHKSLTGLRYGGSGDNT